MPSILKEALEWLNRAEQAPEIDRLLREKEEIEKWAAVGSA
jgi:hypothetical protein